MLIHYSCVQMRVVDRDARHAAELKVQIDQLRMAIEQISQHIAVRQHVPDDNEDEQTQIVDDMQDIKQASINLQRRATERFDYLTALSEVSSQMEQGVANGMTSSEAEHSGSLSAALNPLPEGDSVLDTLSQPASPLSSASLSPGASRMIINDPLTRSPSMSVRNEGPISVPGSALIESSHTSIYPHARAVSSNAIAMSASQPTAFSISAQDFEQCVADLLTEASEQEMGLKRPYSDDVMTRIADLLSAVGKERWAERPRTYLVLRLIEKVKSMDDLVLDGFKDIDFPYTELTMPPSIIESGAQRAFLNAQRYVLSERSADLVRGGKHRHFGKICACCSSAHKPDNSRQERRHIVHKPW